MECPSQALGFESLPLVGAVSGGTWAELVMDGGHQEVGGLKAYSSARLLVLLLNSSSSRM